MGKEEPFVIRKLRPLYTKPAVELFKRNCAGHPKFAFHTTFDSTVYIFFTQNVLMRISLYESDRNFGKYLV